jgi:hypothetical protein
MNPTTALMLAKSIHQEHLATARRRPARPAQPVREPGRSAWSEMLRVYQLGFDAKP